MADLDQQSLDLKPTSGQINQLREYISIEASKAIGFRQDSWQDRFFKILFWLPALRFGRLALEFDQQVEENGFHNAARWLLPRFADRVTVSGAENIPLSGPVILVSNHPGAFDGLVIIAQLNRDDLKLIVSDVPITRGLQVTKNYLIYSTGVDIVARMNAVRQSIRHLESGGMLMLFPTGLVDPDPAFMPGAEDALSDWSASLQFFIRKVPQARLLPTIVSGVIAPRYMNHLFARNQKTVRSKQKAAEYIEIAQLMILQKSIHLQPKVSFGELISLTDSQRSQPDEIMKIVIENARMLLAEHMNFNNP